MTDAPPELTVLIPAYNESSRLGATLGRIDDWIGQTNRRAGVLVVDDGSRDDTAELARAFEPKHTSVRVLVNEGNRGKGYSVRRGMLEATGHRILMTDADLSTPIEEFEKFTPHLAAGFDVVIGSRDLPDSVLDPPQPFLRRMMGGVFRTIRRILMLPDLRDTQCGFKCFSRDAARAVFEGMVDEGFAFDCEALGRARRLGFRIREVGVVWRDDRRSSLRPGRDSIRMFLSLIKIRWRLRKVRPANAEKIESRE